jgi:hypothetical protein
MVVVLAASEEAATVGKVVGVGPRPEIRVIQAPHLATTARAATSAVKAL